MHTAVLTCWAIAGICWLVLVAVISIRVARERRLAASTTGKPGVGTVAAVAATGPLAAGLLLGVQALVG